ncbi:MAG: gliding motility protein RemB [Flavobacteriaceae bacterium]|nr:gliding motility protein RemB [Flavobacteriaceae bacterium]
MSDKILKHFFCWLFVMGLTTCFAQNGDDPLLIYPQFAVCADGQPQEIRRCFHHQVDAYVKDGIAMSDLSEDDRATRVQLLFEVDQNGKFNILFVDTVSEALRLVINDIFDRMPVVLPATYDGRIIYKQFTLTLANGQNEKIVDAPDLFQATTHEYDQIVQKPYEHQQFNSGVLIPLSHMRYDEFDAALNRIGNNSHTAQKPYRFQEVSNYYDLAAAQKALSKHKSTWFGRKWWDEHMVAFSSEDYWFTLDPGVDLQAGRDGALATYNNTRLVHLQGGIGAGLSLNAVVYESQGRFADYYNQYAESIRPDGGNPAIIPGMGIAKEFKTDGYDYPIATGYLSYNASKFFNVQLGHGKQFIGDGYRSLLLSDNASPYPYLQLNTTVWKLKYTNTWMSLRDVRPEVTQDGSFRTKYMANHYLSYNVSKRLNLGFFETVIWENDNDRGFDVNYLNPIVFYRAIEFSTGSRGGNALLGLTYKYKWTDRFNIYGQLLVDEFSSSDVLAKNGSYKNKTAYQLGGKYYDAFGVDHLNLQVEYNRVRPFTYAHNTVVLNYGHNNQSMAHTLGTNFSEFLAIARYRNGRFYATGKWIVATRGLEYEATDPPVFNGGSIYGSEDFRDGDLNHELGQGNTADFSHVEVTAGYLINPASQLKIYASILRRQLTPKVEDALSQKQTTTWINFGIRTDLFNWYRDF